MHGNLPRIFARSLQYKGSYHTHNDHNDAGAKIPPRDRTSPDDTLGSEQRGGELGQGPGKTEANQLQEDVNDTQKEA